MTGWVVAHEAAFRGSAFASVFLAMVIAEVLLEERPRHVARQSRWLHNLGLTLINTAVLRVVFLIGAMSAALWADRHSLGLLHLVNWNPSLEIVLSIVVLDLVMRGTNLIRRLHEDSVHPQRSSLRHRAELQRPASGLCAGEA